MSSKNCLNYADKEKLQYAEKSLSLCYLTSTDITWIDMGYKLSLCSDRPDNKLPSHDTANRKRKRMYGIDEDGSLPGSDAC